MILSTLGKKSVAHSIAVLTDYNKGGPKCKDHPIEDSAYVCTDASCPDNWKLILYCGACLMENMVHKHPHKPKKVVNEEVLELYTALKSQTDELYNIANKMYTDAGPLIRYLEDQMPAGSGQKLISASMAELRALVK